MSANVTGTHAVIRNVRGLHATPACMLSQLAMKYESKIRLQVGDKNVNAKALISVVSLGAKTGDKIIITAEGQDSYDAVQAIADLIEVRNFDGE